MKRYWYDMGETKFIWSDGDVFAMDDNEYQRHVDIPDDIVDDEEIKNLMVEQAIRDLVEHCKDLWKVSELGRCDNGEFR